MIPAWLPLAASLLAASAAAHPGHGADEPIPWGCNDHAAFFRYHEYLGSLNNPAALNAESWGRLDLRRQRERLEDAGRFLSARLAELLAKDRVETHDLRFIERIWGKDAAKALLAVGDARGNANLDLDARRALVTSRIQAFRDAAESIRGLEIGWTRIFDGATDVPSRTLPDHVREEARADRLAAPARDKHFVQRLEEPEVRRALASKHAFTEFLHSRDVPAEAFPGLGAMYEMLSRAEGEERRELSHLLPTVARFLLDNGRIERVRNSRKGDAFAVGGDYDQPRSVQITDRIVPLDPLLAGEVFAHEFQHIYDMYVGRHYTIESEMRGRKAQVLFYRALKKTAPRKYEALRNSDDDEVRNWIRYSEDYIAAYEKGPQAFHQKVAFTSGYANWHEGFFEGRMPLRESLNPLTGIPVQLASLRAEIGANQGRVQELSAEQERLRAARDKERTRTLDRELEKVTRDLNDRRQYLVETQKRADLLELRMQRMQSQVEWLNRKPGAGKEPFDLYLQVDKGYVTP